MTQALEQKYLARRESDGTLYNRAKRCIRCGDPVNSEQKFSCDECFKIVKKRMMSEESGDPYR
jgi:hypothetical protein